MSSTTPFLSIAIPTYNRAPRLESALESLFREIDALAPADRDDVEVVVCSNGSTDDTEAIVRRWMTTRPGLHFFANERNLGIDENIRRVVRHATGRHVRLLSDDDVLVAGSLGWLARVLRQRPDMGFLFLNASTIVVEDGIEGVRAPVIERAFSDTADGLVDFNPEAFVEVIGVWLTFVSSFVVRRDLWVNDRDDSSYVGTDIFLSYKAIDAVTAAGQAQVMPAISIGVRPHFSGSYRIFNAFGPEWRKLMLGHAVACGLGAEAMKRTWMQSVRVDLIPRIGRARLSGTFDDDARQLVLRTLSDTPALRRRVRAMLWCPSWLLKAAKTLRKRLLRNQASPYPFVGLGRLT